MARNKQTNDDYRPSGGRPGESIEDYNDRIDDWKEAINNDWIVVMIDTIKKEKENEINVKMRIIGYYMSEDQFMRTEAVFPEKAEKLAELLRITFDTILENRYVDDEMKAVFNGNTVFILKGENGRLYGYYPKYNIARLTNVHYVKPDVTPMPNMYKRWFYPGERFHLYKPKENSSDLDQ